jgi:peptidoglycan/xylan/chitin deacetylase (PgdA/CDA1 family)
MSRRALASSLASRLKLVSVLERVAVRPSLIVLIYHRVANPDDCAYDRAVIEATPAMFDDQMAMLKRRHVVVGADELGAIVAGHERLRHPRVAITFDDGYRDNYSVVYPILRSHGLPGLFFLATQFVGSRELVWWDRIAFAVRHTKRRLITLALPTPLVVEVDHADREIAIQTVLRAYKRTLHMGDAAFFAMLEEACDLEIPRLAEEPPFLSWDEAAEMQRGGMGIGSHTHSHRILGSLSPEEQRSELRDSRKQLVDRGFEAANFLAYPVGGPSDFSEVTKREARDAGFTVGFSNYGGINVPGQTDAFDVMRIAIDLSESMTQLRFRLAASGLVGRAVW